MNNLTAAHNQHDLITIYSKSNNEYNNYSRSHSSNLLLKLILPVIIIAVITLGSIMVKASETDTRPYLKKYYTSIEVTADDTLWSLEAGYNNGTEDRDTYINNIMQLNNMTSDTIITGNHLLLYYYSSDLN